MKTFIRHNATLLLSSALFVSLCLNYFFSIRIVDTWLWGTTMKEHLFYNDHYRKPMICAGFIGWGLLTIMGVLLVRYLYRRQKREYEKLSVWRWVGIMVTGALTLIFPAIFLLYGIKILLIYAIVYLLIMMIYLVISHRNRRPFQKQKRGESEKSDE